MSRATIDGPNIMFVVVDTTRADALGLGVDGGVAPELSAAADGGRVYLRATSPAPWTPPAHASMFSGLAPSEHGVWGPNLLDDHGWPRRGALHGPLLDRWLPSLLLERGYRTVGISANAWISEYLGFDHGFERFLTIKENPSGKTGQSRATRIARRLPDPLVGWVKHRRMLARLRNRGQDWGATRAMAEIREYLREPGAPFFAFVNLMEPHWPCHPPPDFEGFSREEADLAVEVLLRYRSPLKFDAHGRITKRELPLEDVAMLRRLYMGEVTYLDRRLGELLRWLDDAGRMQDTVVVIVADHGEHIGEHGLLGHVGSVHEELLHVPLLVLGPVELVGRGTEHARVSTQSLYRAVLDWANCESAMLPRPTPVVAEYEGAWNHAGSVRRAQRDFHDGASKASSWALYDEDWKFVFDSAGREWLHDLGNDPSETTDVSGDGRRDVMRRRLAEAIADRRPPLLGPGAQTGERDLVVERELRALGYL
jgi:arylsulfatase A-like enzyme